MFPFDHWNPKAISALLLAGIAPVLPAFAQDEVIILPIRKGSKSAQVEKVKPESEAKTTQAPASDSAEEKPPSKTNSSSAGKKEKATAEAGKPSDRKPTQPPVRKTEQADEDAGKARETERAQSRGPQNKPAVAERAKSFLTNIGRKADVFNTDYKTRPGSADIPPTLSGNGYNGRNLPIGGEDMYRLSGMPEDYMPTDLVLIPKYYSYTGQPVYLRKPAADSFIRMVSDAERQGLTIRIFSGFRDIGHQRRLYAEAVARRGKNQKGVARPGKSEHMLGTTADVTSTERYLMKRSFADTPEGKWLSQHAPQYGWRMTVVRGEGPRSHVDEPWHIRYFGTGAREMVEAPQKRDGVVKKTVKGIGKLFGLGR